MEMDEKCVCFTGHRELNEPSEHIVKRLDRILPSLIEQGYRHFLAGGARGFDALAALTVLKWKEVYPGIHLTLILPFRRQYEADRNWTHEDIEVYHHLLSHTSVVYLGDHYRRGCYYLRNRYMIDHSSLCISYQYKPHGGTAYTTRYAKEKRIQVINCANV